MQKINSLVSQVPLTHLKINEKATVYGFSNEEFPIKIMELGILENTPITIKSKVPFHGPVLVEFGESNARVALRRKEAASILVNR